MTRDETFTGLAVDLEALFSRGVDARLEDEAFDAMALRVFAHQFEASPTYRAFCEGRGATPATVARWQEVPAVPALAFKHVELSAGEGGPPEAVFLTSGTSTGTGVRGRHLVPRLSLYRASLLPNARAHLLPEGVSMPVLSLVPSPEAAPDSSLSAMVGAIAGAWGEPTRWLARPAEGPDARAFAAASAVLADERTPALVLGTAFALVHLLDALAREGVRVRLPEGTRLMETGGFKGRSRTVERGELYRAVEEGLGIPPGRVVNEYGMTELLSQLYEPVLREGPGAPRRHVPPPWLRVRALDPRTLEPLPPGAPGLLAFFDLANAGSVSHVLTGDMGSVDARGVWLLGRAPGAEPRGCSLVLEELLAVAEPRP